MKPHVPARVLVLLALAGPFPLAAQSSQFGIRGIGLPGRALSPRSFGAAGAFGLFDQESALNPAALGRIGVLTASFTTVQNWRTSENDAGSSTGKDNRFPQVFVAGPVRGTPLAVGFSVGAYADRSFALASRDTVSIAGVSIPVDDTLFSRGGISDIRLGVAARLGGTITLGVGIHGLTGSTKLESKRVFADTTFAPATSTSNLTLSGYGVSVGAVAQFGTSFALAVLARTDEKLRIERDTLRIGTTDLPTSLRAGVAFAPTSRLTIAGEVGRRNWSVADRDIKSQGGIGAVDTYEVAGGLELITNSTNPFHRPLRVGVRYGTLPFPLADGGKPSELGISLGTGFRFTANRGGVDIALERVSRTQAGGFSERAFLLTVGVSIRP